jgi:hypothetical protein
MRKLLLALAVIATALTVGLAVIPDAGATADAHSWYVCKYVGPPGTPDEVLQGGGNPIFVDENAIDVSPVSVGATFGDAQTHSLVIAGPFAPPGAEVEPTCPTTPPPPPSPPPATTTPPPVVTPPACPGSVTLGPWYGDPQINITLTGAGTFVVSGGVQRFSGTTTFTRTLACNESFRIGRYKVQHGHFLTVTQDGAVVVHVKPPRVR